MHRAAQGMKEPEFKTVQPREMAHPPFTDVHQATCQPRHDCKTGVRAHSREVLISLPAWSSQRPGTGETQLSLLTSEYPSMQMGQLTVPEGLEAQNSCEESKLDGQLLTLRGSI